MKVAILFDGSFFIKKFQKAAGCGSNLPSSDIIVETCNKIMSSKELVNDFLFRSYFYDCYPYSGDATSHPITGEECDFASSPVASARKSYLDNIKILPSMALRSGVLSLNGWKVPPQKIKNVISALQNGKKLNKGDMVPNIQQKQVDMKIGLDVAWMSSKKIVDKIVLFTGDSDFIPAMKFARKEGILVYIAKFNYTLKQQLLEHSDGVIEIDWKVDSSKIESESTGEC